MIYLVNFKANNNNKEVIDINNNKEGQILMIIMDKDKEYMYNKEEWVDLIIYLMHFKCFFEKDFDEVKFEELKEIVRNSVK